MPKAPQTADEVLPKVVKDLQDVFGPELVSVVLYGSAAGDEYRPGLSDMNLLVVISESGLSSMARLAPAYQSWRKLRVAPPMVVTPAEIESSLDAFPLEFLNMKLRYKMAFGLDPLAEVSVDPADLRLQCERELKGKLFLLREAMFSTGGREEELRETALASIKAFVAIFRGVLHLLGEEAGALSGGQVLKQAAGRLELNDGSVLNEVWELRDLKKQPKGRLRQLFGSYLSVIAEAAAKIDTWTPEG